MPSPAERDPGQLYLDLLKKCLSRYIFDDSPSFDPKAREQGIDWPAQAETMIGLRRLDNLEECVTDIVRRGIPGDLIETGVWRGGAVIFMRAVLQVFGDLSRKVWVADSFQGLPQPDVAAYPSDEGDLLWTKPELAVTQDEVEENFRRYGLLDEQVCFLPGWFKDTLPNLPVERFCLLRLDGDMYESTIQALESLYPKLSVGGYVIIDDFGAIPACKAAVEDFRSKHHIDDEMREVDWTAVFWERSGAGPILHPDSAAPGRLGSVQGIT